MWNSVISLCGLNYSGYCSADDLYPKSSREVKCTEPQSLSSRSNKLKYVKDGSSLDLDNSSREVKYKEPQSLSSRSKKLGDIKDGSPPKNSIWQQASTFKLKLENNGDESISENVEKSVSAFDLLSTSNKSNCKKYALKANHQLYEADHELFAKVCRSVEAIVVKYRSGEKALKGTCFRIGTQFVLTSYHVYEQVLKEAHIVESVFINFDYKEPDPSTHRVFPCARCPLVSSGTEYLDYAVLILVVQDGTVLPPSLTGMLSLPGFSKNLEVGRFLYFAGHPGEDKTATNSFCPVQSSDTLAKRFATTLRPQDKKWLNDKHVETYHISTFKHGSSGSPGFLLAEKFLMVMHTRGVCLDQHSGEYIEQGVMIPSIVADVCYKIKCGLLKYQSKELFGFERPK